MHKLIGDLLSLSVAVLPWTAVGYFAQDVPAWAAALGGGLFAFICGAFYVIDRPWLAERREAPQVER